MWTATITVSALLAALLVYSGANKLRGGDDVIRAYARVGVPATKLPALAVLLHAGGLGLVAGLWWSPLGITTAACVTVYFLGALAAHVRFRELKTLPMPSVLFVLALAALALRIATHQTAL